MDEINSEQAAKKVRITKCYLIEVCDKDGKELDSDFFFGNYQDAKLQGEIMKNKYNSET